MQQASWPFPDYRRAAYQGGHTPRLFSVLSNMCIAVLAIDSGVMIASTA